MNIKPPPLRALSNKIPTFLLPCTTSSSSSITTTKPLSLSKLQTRHLHHRIIPPSTPKPTPFVPDTSTFLTLIGRNLSQYATKIPSWAALFSLSPRALKELGIEPPRTRRYLLRWREKFRRGVYGVGGDARYVSRGVAFVRVVDVDVGVSEEKPLGVGTGRVVVNVREEDLQKGVGAGAGVDGDGCGAELVRVKGVRVKGARTVTGSHVVPVNGDGVAKIQVKEGLWEERRGRKIDGGERRMAEVRAKRRGEERKNAK